MNSKGIAATLVQAGICVCPHFLGPRTSIATADDLDAIRARGDFRSAGVGRGAKPGDNEPRARRDETYWLNRGTSGAQVFLWRKLDVLKLALNREHLLGLTHFDGHYAAYPEGGFYERHLDQFRRESIPKKSSRVVSLVIYLNRNWQPADGGRLRVYAKDAGGESHIDVDPLGGTMVCFFSEVSEHEVMLSHRPRFSFAGWFR